MLDVLFVTNAGGDGRVQYGGAERMLSELLPVLNRELRLACVTPEGRLADQLREQGVRVIALGPSATFDWRYALRIRSLLRRESPRLMACHLLSASLHGRIAGLTLGITISTTLHNNLHEIRSSATGPLAKLKAQRAIALDWLLDKACRGRHEYVAVSAYDLRMLARRRDRVTLIRNSLPSLWPGPSGTRRASARAQLQLDDRLVLLYIGRFELQKGVDALWRAAESLPAKWQLLVVGEGRLEPPAIPSITNLGWSSDASQVLSAADAVVMPSRWEVFGKTGLEALSLGTCLISTDTGGLGDLHEEVPECTALIASTTAEDINVALSEWEQPDLEMRLESARLIQDRYSFAAAAQAWLSYLERRLHCDG